MPRSVILTGRSKQLDRARQRGRLDRIRRERGKSSSDGAKDALKAWMEANISIRDLADIERLDLDACVRDTISIDLPPEERLRQLAIFLEHEVTWRSEQPQSWLALDRIYAAAVKLQPDEPRIYHSRALSAQECAECLERQNDQEWVESPIRKRLMKAAYDAAYEALRFASDEAYSHSLMGSLMYDDPERTPEEALEWCEEAISLDSEHGWSLLNRAHCLHDIKRWAEAVAAYNRVPKAFFVGPSLVWRYEHLLEQRAICLLEAGQVDRAQEEFEALLTRWEQNPHLAREGWGLDLAQAARGPLRAKLFDRTLALFEREFKAAVDDKVIHIGFTSEPAMLMNIYWIDLETKGRLAMMPRPRGGDWLEDELRHLRRKSVGVLVSMLEPDEAQRLELDHEQTLCEAQGIEFYIHPVRDRDVPPSQREVYELAVELATRLKDGQNVIVHCRDGIGRSGLMAASIVIVLGLGVGVVLESLRRARGLDVPETDEQVEWVRRFADAVELYSTMGT